MPNQPAARSAPPLYLGAIVALLAAGIGLRAWGLLFEPLDLWADEAWWATLLDTWQFGDLGIRPVGYMWLCRELLAFGSPERMLRLPSWLAGAAALVFIWKSGELSYRSRATVLFVLLLAVFHPKLIAFAKEFKPYSVDVFVFSALTFWALACLRRGRPSAGFLAAAVIAVPFCYPVVFLYPAIACAFAGERLAVLRRFTPAQWMIALLAAVAVLLFLHLFLLEALQVAQNRSFWGGKYDVFPIDTSLVGGAAWYVRKTWALLCQPGALEGFHPAVASLSGVAAVGGIAALIAARRWRELALLCGPLAAASVANLLGYWPYGAFRANLFLIPGAILQVGHGVDRLTSGSRARFATYALFIAVLLAAVAIDPRSYGTKLSTHWTAAPQLTEALDEIDRRFRESPGTRSNVILADWHAWRPAAYYLRDYPLLQDHVRLVRGPLADTARLEAQIEAEFARARSEGRATRLWIVITQLQPHRAIASSARVVEFSDYRREFESQDRDYHPILFELRF